MCLDGMGRMQFLTQHKLYAFTGYHILMMFNYTFAQTTNTLWTLKLHDLSLVLSSVYFWAKTNVLLLNKMLFLENWKMLETKHYVWLSSALTVNLIITLSWLDGQIWFKTCQVWLCMHNRLCKVTYQFSLCRCIECLSVHVLCFAAVVSACNRFCS